MKDVCVFLDGVEESVAGAAECWGGPLLAFGANLVTSAAGVVQIPVVVYLSRELACGAEVVDFKVVFSAELGLVSGAVGAVREEILTQVGPVVLIVRESGDVLAAIELHSSVSSVPG